MADFVKRNLTKGEQRLWQGGLSGKQVAFVKAYLESGDAKAAYLAVHGGTPNAAKTSGSRALRHPVIADIVAVARQRAAMLARDLAVQQKANEPEEIEKYAISQEIVSRNLARLAFSNMRDYLEWGPDGIAIKHSDQLTAAQSYAVMEISQTARGTIKFKLADKRMALMDLAKLQGLFDGDEPPPAPDEEKRQRVRRELYRMLSELAKPEPLVIEARAGEQD